MEVLRNWRHSEHLTMLQAAYRLDVSLTTYSAWESGKHRMSRKNIIRVSAETGIDMETLRSAS